MLIAVLLVAWIDRGRRRACAAVRGAGCGCSPGWARLLADFEAANFAELLALLLEHQVPYPSALVLAAEAAGAPRLVDGAGRVAEAIRRGAPVATAVEAAGRGAFPPMLRWTLATGQAQGSLVSALHHLAELYRRRATYRAEQIALFLPMILTLGDRRQRGGVLRDHPVPPAGRDPARAVGRLKPWPTSICRVHCSIFRFILKIASSQRERRVSGMSDSPGSNGAGMGGGLSGDAARALRPARRAGPRRSAAGLQPGRAGRGAAAGPAPAFDGRSRPAGSRRACRSPRRSTIQEGRIPPHLRGLVAAGVRSGRLGEVLGEFSQYAATGIELRRRLWLNLAYPTLSLLVTLVVFAFVGIVVVPQFEAIFADFGIPLPGDHAGRHRARPADVRHLADARW